MSAIHQREYKRRNPEKVRAAWRRWRLRHPKENADRVKKWVNKVGYYTVLSARARRKYPWKVAAWQAVYRAVKAGILTRPTHCSKCHKTCRPEAHHEDYSKRLEVEWLCRGCHLSKTGRTIRIPKVGDSQ